MSYMRTDLRLELSVTGRSGSEQKLAREECQMAHLAHVNTATISTALRINPALKVMVASGYCTR